MELGVSHCTQIVQIGGTKTTHSCYDRGRSQSRERDLIY